MFPCMRSTMIFRVFPYFDSFATPLSWNNITIARAMARAIILDNGSLAQCLPARDYAAAHVLFMAINSPFTSNFTFLNIL